jgi:hypothetical protein
MRLLGKIISSPFLTYLNMGQGELQSAIGRLLQSRSERGFNSVAWWGGEVSARRSS